MSGLHTLYALKEGLLRRNRVITQISRKRFSVKLFFEIGMIQKSFDLGSE